MHRHLYILIGFLLLAGSLFAESELPVIEIKADRTMIYPQRMELTGEESLMDILQMVPDRVKGFVEAQGDFGKDVAGIGSVNALYGSQHTDLYANTSYRHQDGNEEYLTLHMTNRFDFCFFVERKYLRASAFSLKRYNFLSSYCTK